MISLWHCIRNKWEERGRWEERFQERREAGVRRVVDKPPPTPFTSLTMCRILGVGGPHLRNRGPSEFDHF